MRSRRQYAADWFVAYLVPRWMYVAWHRVCHFKSWRAQVAHDKLLPRPGGYAYYHDEGPFKVANVEGLELVLLREDGTMFAADWQCCDPA